MKNEKYKVKQFLKDNNITKSCVSFKTNKDYIFSYFNVIEILVEMIQKSNFCYYDFANDILESLNERIEIDNRENSIEIKKCAKALKNKAIAKIKSIKRTSLDNDKRLKFLKDLANRLECLEVLYTFADSKKMLKVEYDFINYVLFEQKNLYHSKELINGFPYLINVFTSNSPVLDNLVQNYIDSLLNYVNNDNLESKKDLIYYNELIQLVVSNAKIRFEKEDLLGSLVAIKKTFNNLRTSSVKTKEEASLWLNHLYKMLNEDNYEPDMDTLRSMYGIRNHFKRSIYDEVDLLLENDKSSCDSSDYIITIDGVDTLLRDDALSVRKNENGNYILRIYISDPNHYFPTESLIMLEAKKRTQSIYLEDVVEPMFPDVACEKCLSLNEGKNRYARIYEYEIDKYGEIVNFKIDKGLINVDKNLTYDEVNEMVLNLDPKSKLEETILNLCELKSKIGKSYINKFDFDGGLKHDLTKSEELIQTYMIFNNNKLAEYFRNNHLPFIYRYHELKNNIKFGLDFDDLNNKDQEAFKQMLKQLEKVNMQAFYSSKKCKHDGLELEAYCHSTSPGRQYSGIVVNQCCDMFIFGNPTDKQAYQFIDDLNDVIDYLNYRDKEVLHFYNAYARSRSQR